MRGVFDGKNHSIRNLLLNDYEQKATKNLYAGLFDLSTTAGTIKNFSMLATEIKIEADYSVAAYEKVTVGCVVGAVLKRSDTDVSDENVDTDKIVIQNVVTREISIKQRSRGNSRFTGGIVGEVIRFVKFQQAKCIIQ